MHANTSHTGLNGQMHLHRLALPYRFLRQCFNEIHAADRLRNICIDDLTRTLRLHESKNEQGARKSSSPQLECLRERCYGDIVCSLVQCDACCGDCSVSVRIRLNYSTEFCPLLDAAANLSIVMGESTSINFRPCCSIRHLNHFPSRRISSE